MGRMRGFGGGWVVAFWDVGGVGKGGRGEGDGGERRGGGGEMGGRGEKERRRGEKGRWGDRRGRRGGDGLVGGRGETERREGEKRRREGRMARTRGRGSRGEKVRCLHSWKMNETREEGGCLWLLGDVGGRCFRGGRLLHFSKNIYHRCAWSPSWNLIPRVSRKCCFPINALAKWIDTTGQRNQLPVCCLQSRSSNKHH